MEADRRIDMKGERQRDRQIERRSEGTRNKKV
jgi:hypothetical protein